MDNGTSSWLSAPPPPPPPPHSQDDIIPTSVYSVVDHMNMSYEDLNTVREGGRERREGGERGDHVMGMSYED